MSDPYEILELTPDAGETEIRQRYLELVRKFPPDRAPERFAAIHAAYASLRDPSERVRADFRACKQERLVRVDHRRPAFEVAGRPASGRCIAALGRLAMNDPIDVEAILDRFRDWLENVRVEADNPRVVEPRFQSEPEASSREFGLIDLVEEFTALRHELKLQTKSGRGLIEQSENTISALRLATDHLRAVDAAETQAAWTAGKALAEALADLDEAVVRGQREIEKARKQIADQSVRDLEASVVTLFRRQSWIRRRFSRAYHQQVVEAIRRDGLVRHELFESFLEGFSLIHKRLRRALASEQIMHIACEGHPVDPEFMTVIEVVDEPRDRPGTVVKELRRGYTWKGRVIRFAEVQAVRTIRELQSAPENDGTIETETDESASSPPID